MENCRYTEVHAQKLSHPRATMPLSSPLLANCLELSRDAVP